MKEKRTTKRALVSSVITFALCVAMLIGTTFAWFTDTASTGVNKIVAGTLDIELQMKDTKGDWVNAEGKTLDFKKAASAAAGEEILWEPGCTYELPALRLVNKGNLALKYKVKITGIKGDEKLNEVIDWTIGDADLESDHKLAAGATSDEWTIKGHMQEAAGNEYQGLTIDGIAITVYATQDTVESDSYNNTYDANATYPVASTEDLKQAVEEAGGNFTVGDDIPVTPVVPDKTVQNLFPQMTVKKDTTLNLNGKTIGVDAAASSEDYGKASLALMTVDHATLTIDGKGVVSCEAGNNQVYGVNIVNGGKVVVNSGEFYGAMTAFQVQNGTLEINGGFFDMAPTCKKAVPQYAKYVVNAIDASYKDGTAIVTIKGGTFVNFDPSANPEGAGTSYVAKGYKVVSEKQENGDTWYTVTAE